MNIEKLNKMIGRDVKQAARYAESLDETAARVRAEISALEAEKLRLAESLASTTEKAAEAWEYVQYLKNAQKV